MHDRPSQKSWGCVRVATFHKTYALRHRGHTTLRSPDCSCACNFRRASNVLALTSSLGNWGVNPAYQIPRCLRTVALLSRGATACRRSATSLRHTVNNHAEAATHPHFQRQQLPSWRWVSSPPYPLEQERSSGHRVKNGGRNYRARDMVAQTSCSLTNT